VTETNLATVLCWHLIVLCGHNANIQLLSLFCSLRKTSSWLKNLICWSNDSS